MVNELPVELPTFLKYKTSLEIVHNCMQMRKPDKVLFYFLLVSETGNVPSFLKTRVKNTGLYYKALDQVLPSF